MAIKSIEQAFEALAEQTSENRSRLKKLSNQRRFSVVDDYGKEFSGIGDNNNPAIIYLSVSPDLGTLSRFQFKIQVKPFAIPIATSSGGISATSLSVSESGGVHTVSPNPHTHTVQSGITLYPTTANDWHIYINDTEDDSKDIDLTAYLRYQAETMPHGRWIQGTTGIYPSMDLEDSDRISGSFDLIEACNDMYAEGKESIVRRIESGGMKRLKIRANAPFQISLYLYLKYSGNNR